MGFLLGHILRPPYDDHGSDTTHLLRHIGEVLRLRGGAGRRHRRCLIKFASEETPPALRAAFAVFVNARGPDRQASVFLAEVLWSALHGMVVLMQSERIPAIGAEDRLDILVQKFSSDYRSS